MKKIAFLIYPLCGVLCALPAISGDLWFLGWIMLAPILYIERTRRTDAKHAVLKAFFRGFALYYAYSLVTFYWFVELYPLEFTGLTPAAALAVVVAAWFGLPILQAVPFAFFCVLINLYCRKTKDITLFPIYCASLWVVFEWIQTLTWAGVPWGKLALGQTSNLANVQSASLLGAYFVAFLMVLVAGLLAVSVIHLINKSTKRAAILLICAITVFCANNIYGNLRLISTFEGSNEITVSAIQANISSDDKWSDDILFTFDTYETLTEQASNNDPDIIIWPESAIPVAANTEDVVSNYINRLYNEFGTDLIVGTFYEDDNGLYNVTAYIDSDTDLFTKIYAKRKLVPFGEFVPLRNIISIVYPPLSDLSILSEDILKGEDANVFNTRHGKIGSLICFDSIYESVVRETVLDGAELLSISTNDSWFHDSSAVYQHNKHAILRSIENGRYTIRSANTGISSIITDRGVVNDMIAPLKQGILTGNVKMLDYATPYTVVGNLLVWLCIAYTLSHITVIVIKDYKNGHTHRQRKCR